MLRSQTRMRGKLLVFSCLFSLVALTGCGMRGDYYGTQAGTGGTPGVGQHPGDNPNPNQPPEGEGHRDPKRGDRAYEGIGEPGKGQLGGSGTATPVNGMRSSDPHSGAQGMGGKKE